MDINFSFSSTCTKSQVSPHGCSLSRSPVLNVPTSNHDVTHRSPDSFFHVSPADTYVYPSFKIWVSKGAEKWNISSVHTNILMHSVRVKTPSLEGANHSQSALTCCSFPSSTNLTCFSSLVSQHTWHSSSPPYLRVASDGLSCLFVVSARLFCPVHLAPGLGSLPAFWFVVIVSP